MESLIASAIGFRIDLPDKERKAMFRQAQAIRLAVEKGTDVPISGAAAALPAIIRLIPVSAAARALWDTRRKEVEAAMAQLAEGLSIYPWAKAVRGLGALGLAILVGEAGIPIGDYRTVSGLWSRLGLGVHNGVRQKGETNSAKLARPDGSPMLRYNPARRAEVWAICSDSLFRAQWRGAKDEDGKNPTVSGKPAVVEAHPIGPYGEIYGRRRAQTAARVDATADLPATDPAKWTAGRAANDARRIMTKALILDMWVEWRRLETIRLA